MTTTNGDLAVAASTFLASTAGTEPTTQLIEGDPFPVCLRRSSTITAGR
jgi:hypothetical protein